MKIKIKLPMDEKSFSYEMTCNGLSVTGRLSLKKEVALVLLRHEKFLMECGINLCNGKKGYFLSLHKFVPWKDITSPSDIYDSIRESLMKCRDDILYLFQNEIKDELFNSLLKTNK